MAEPDGDQGSVPGGPGPVRDDVTGHEVSGYEVSGHEPDYSSAADPLTGEPEVPDTRAIDRGVLRYEPGPTPGRGLPVSVRPVRAPITVVRRTLGSTAALRASLAAKEAEANELRDSIDDLKRQLTIERSMDLPEHRRAMPWWTLALILAVILLALLALLSYCTRPSTSSPGSGANASAGASAVRPTATGGVASGTASSGDSAGASAAATGASAATTAGASVATSAAVVPTPSPAAPSVTTTAMPWAGSTLLVPTGLAGTGPGVDADGSDVTYVLDADGTSLDAYERVRAAAGVPQVTAQLTPLTALTGELAAAKLGVSGLQVELNGQAVTPRPSGTGTWTAALPDGTPVTSAVLRYKLTGAVLRVEPARAGRLAALLTPLTSHAVATSGQKVTVHVLGPGLVSLTCPLAPAAGVLCGTVSSGAAMAALPPGLAPVAQLQFDRG